MSNVRAIQTFVIHLERAVGRKEQVQDCLNAAPFPAEILPAVDGSALAQWPIKPTYEPAYPFELKAGEVGCFLSHRAAWQRILDRNLDAGLIIEDDVRLLPGFDDIAEFAATHVDDLGYVQFQTRSLKTGCQIVASHGALQLVRPNVVPLRTSAQIVSQAAAKRLLEASVHIDRPVDVFLQMFWETGIRPHVALPSNISDQTEQTGGSTIKGKQKSILVEVKKSWQRWRYRSSIARLSK